jgi:hypothetical protein
MLTKARISSPASNSPNRLRHHILLLDVSTKGFHFVFVRMYELWMKKPRSMAWWRGSKAKHGAAGPAFLFGSPICQWA